MRVHAGRSRGWWVRACGLAVGGGALALTGCTSLHEYVHNGFKVGPNYATPPAPVAPKWIDADDKRVRCETADLSHWWGVFNDPALDGLISHSVGQNLTLREAGYRILAARAQLGVSIGELFPQTQGFSGSYSARSFSTEIANRQFVRTRFYDQWDLGFGLQWELDFWGRFRRAIEAQADVLDATVAEYDDVLVTLLGDVATAYTQMRSAEQQLAYVRANIELQKVTLGIAKARFEGGQVTELDVDQAQSILAQTEALAPQLEIQIRQATNRLCVLMGVPPEELRTKLGAAPIPVAPAEAVVGIPADLLTRRPDIRRADRRAAAECARIGIAEAQLYPAVVVTGDLNWSASHFGDLFRPTALESIIQPGVQWQLLNYGRIINDIRAQDATFLAAATQYQQTVLKAGEEVENGLVAFLKSQERAKAQAESVKAADKAVQVALTQYKGGLVDFNRVSLLEQNLVEQQNSLAQAQAAIALGLINVYRALGGGWEMRLKHEVPTPMLSPGVAPAAPAAPPAGEVLPPPKPVAG